jgi:hypothetical protein
MEAPVAIKGNCGVRIILDFQLLDKNHKGVIFTYCHRQKKDRVPQITMKQNKRGLLVSFNNKIFPILLKQYQHLFSKRQFIEMAVYPTGQCCVAINGKLILTQYKIDQPISLQYAKTVLGSDLDCKNFGYFKNSLLFIQVIDQHNYTHNDKVYDTARYQPFEGCLPYNLLDRPL